LFWIVRPSNTHPPLFPFWGPEKKGHGGREGVKAERTLIRDYKKITEKL